MTKLKLNLTTSLDGYVAGPNQNVKHPLGEGDEKLCCLRVTVSSL